jgi:calreticulin
MGQWKHTAGEVAPADPEDKGIQTGEDSRHYGISALIPGGAINSEGKDLVVQYSVKFDQKIDCGGAYIKLGAVADRETFSGDTPYQIMFGPDICGGTRKTHVVSFTVLQRFVYIFVSTCSHFWNVDFFSKYIA